MFPGAPQIVGSRIGDRRAWPNIGHEVRDSEGAVWLRSGVYRPAAMFPDAANEPHLQLFGAPIQTSIAKPNIYDLATDGAGVFVLCVNDNTNVYVSTDYGRNWNTLAHGLAFPCCSAAYDATLGYWAFAGSNTTNLKISTTNSIATPPTLRYTGSPSTPTANSAVIRSIGSGSFVAVCTAGGASAVYSTNGTSFAGCSGSTAATSVRLTALPAQGKYWMTGGTTSHLSADATGASWSVQAALATSAAQIGETVYGATYWTSAGVMYYSDMATSVLLPNYALVNSDRPEVNTGASKRLTANKQCWVTQDGSLLLVSDPSPPLNTPARVQVNYKRLSQDLTGATNINLAMDDGGAFVVAGIKNSAVVAVYGNLSAVRYVGTNQLVVPQDTLTASGEINYYRVA